LRRGDLTAFGKLVFDSGYSSIYNYETGSPQLIKLYEIMQDTTGIYGGRFSGAGFKGCCMALIDPIHKRHIEKTVTSEYLNAFPELEGKFSVHFCQTADGVMYQKDSILRVESSVGLVQSQVAS
jgi:galactokinase/galacturonokinase